MLTTRPPQDYYKRRGRGRKRRAIAPPVPLTLIEATFDLADGVYLRLTFDRPIDASNLNGYAINQGVEEYGYLYNATGGYIVIDPATIELTMVYIAPWEYGNALMASSETGIVAIDDGGTWPGVPDTGLPFP